MYYLYHYNYLLNQCILCSRDQRMKNDSTVIKLICEIETFVQTLSTYLHNIIYLPVRDGYKSAKSKGN